MICREVDCTDGQRKPTGVETDLTSIELAERNKALVRTLIRWFPVPLEELEARTRLKHAEADADQAIHYLETRVFQLEDVLKAITQTIRRGVSICENFMPDEDPCPCTCCTIYRIIENG